MYIIYKFTHIPIYIPVYITKLDREDIKLYLRFLFPASFDCPFNSPWPIPRASCVEYS